MPGSFEAGFNALNPRCLRVSHFAFAAVLFCPGSASGLVPSSSLPSNWVRLCFGTGGGALGHQHCSPPPPPPPQDVREERGVDHECVLTASAFSLLLDSYSSDARTVTRSRCCRAGCLCFLCRALGPVLLVNAGDVRGQPHHSSACSPAGNHQGQGLLGRRGLISPPRVTCPTHIKRSHTYVTRRTRARRVLQIHTYSCAHAHKRTRNIKKTHAGHKEKS